MPFELRIDRFESSSSSTTVYGRLLSGRFYGPEDVELIHAGKLVALTVVGSSGATRPQDWPILPEHDTILNLELVGVPAASVNIGMLVRGIGFAQDPAGGRLQNEWLELPHFWAVHYYLLVGADDHDESELCDELLGISNDEFNGFYVEHFLEGDQARPSPYLSLKIDACRSIEVEYAEGAESQTRYKIRDESGPLTLGYNSGHFSLPAFRWAEVIGLAGELTSARQKAQLILLLLPGIWVEQADVADAANHLYASFKELDLFVSSERARLVKNILSHLQMDSVPWSNDEHLGWICAGQYAQRNPKNLLSTLVENDFHRIRTFFQRHSGQA